MKTFSCNGCSGCCHGPISLNFNEVVNKYPGKFPLILTYVVSDVRNVPVEMGNDGYSQAMRKFTKNIIGFYDKTSSGRKIVIHPQIITFLANSSPCPNLTEDRLCSIYDQRPSVCRLYPFRIDTPIAYMEHGLTRERNFSFEGHGHIPCEGWLDSKNIIFSNGMPTDLTVVDDFKARINEAAETTSLLKKYYLFLKSLDGMMEKIDLYSALNDQSGRLIQVSYGGFIDWLVRESKMSKSDACKILISHNEVLKKQLAIYKYDKTVAVKTISSMYEQHLEEADILISSYLR